MKEMLKHAQREEEKERKDMMGSNEADTGAEEGDALLCESATERIEWAVGILNRNLKCFEALLDDLRFATEAVSLNILFPN